MKDYCEKANSSFREQAKFSKRIHSSRKILIPNDQWTPCAFLRLVFTSDRVGVVVRVIRELMTLWKSKIGVVSSHKLNGIRRIRTFPFLPIPFTTPSLMTQWKLGCRSWKQKWKNQPIAKSGIEHCHWFILLLLLTTPTMQFSLDRKQRRHKQNQCSASNSVGLIFTRSYRSTLLIATPTPTPSLVKTSL